MKFACKILIAAVLCLPTTAYCATYNPVHVCWNPPTAREDGTPLPISEISGYRIYYKLSEKSCRLVKNKWLKIKPPNKCVIYLPTSDMEVCFTGVTYDTNGLKSAVSAISCRKPVAIQAPVP